MINKRGFVLLYAILFLCAIQLLPLLAAGQSPNFNKTYDHLGSWDLAWSVVAVDTGYFVAGDVTNAQGNWAVAIMYIDTLGNEVWIKEYGDTVNNFYSGDVGSFVEVTDSGFAMAGTVTYPDGEKNAVLWRFDKNGDTLWTQRYGNDTLGMASYNCKQTEDQGFIIVGNSYDTAIKIMLIKTDSLGVMEWQQFYDGQYAISVDVCNDGGYIIGGDTWINPSPFTDPDSYVIKTDSLGNLEWSKIYGGDWMDGWSKVQATSDNAIIVAFDMDVNGAWGGSDTTVIRVIKLDNQGGEIWDNAIDIYGGMTEVNMIRELSDGNFIIAGSAGIRDFKFGTISGILLKISPQGDSLWYHWYRKCYSFGGGDDHQFNDIRETADGGLVAVGGAWNTCNNNYRDLWVVKLDSLGMCDTSQCEVDCNLPLDYEITNTASLTPSFVNNNVSLADYFWDFGDLSTSTSQNPIHTYASLGTYVITHSVSVGPCTETAIDTITLTVGIDENTLSSEFQIYPNPTTGQFTIEMDLQEQTSLSVNLYHFTGQLIWSEDFGNVTGRFVDEMDLRTYAEGVYFLQISTGNGILTRKVVLY